MSQHHCWDILGIEATTDVTAIKRVYAAKLKITRPDDDAAAYQALRDAYQEALQSAKSAKSDSKSQPERVLAPGSAPDQPDQPDLATLPEPDDLVQLILQCEASGGETALLAHWPQFEQVLHQVPLTRSDEYAIELADLVLEYPALPPRFIDLLRTHYDWGNDFRMADMLGRSLAQQLQERLSKLDFDLRLLELKKNLDQEHEHQLQHRANETEQQKQSSVEQRYGHLSQFARLCKSSSKRSLPLLTILAGPQWRSEWQHLSTEERERLSIDPASHLHGATLLQKACDIRTALVLLLFGATITAQLLREHRFTFEQAAMLLLLCAIHFLSLGTHLEKLRKGPANPIKLDRFLTEEVRAPEQARITNLAACGFAFVFSVGFWNRTPPWGLVAIVMASLLAAWLSHPPANPSMEKNAPMVFALCLYLLQQNDLGNFLFLLSLGALWFSVATVTQTAPWGKAIGFLWILSGTLCGLGGNNGLILCLGFGLPWLLCEIAKRTSGAYLLSLMIFALLSFAHDDKRLLVIWTELVALGWCLVWAAMLWQAKRLLQSKTQTTD